jgi:transposase-like protein
VVTLGVTTDGAKIPLGLWEGSTENATVVTALLADLVERGLDVKQRLRRAWALDDHARALDQLRRLAGELERSNPAPPARSGKGWRKR